MFDSTVNYINIIKKNACELGIFIDPKHQGKGYASECAHERTKFVFETFDCDEIYTTVHPHNEKSIKIQLKQGYVFVAFGNLEPKTNLPENDRNVYRLTKDKWSKILA